MSFTEREQREAERRERLELMSKFVPEIENDWRERATAEFGASYREYYLEQYGQGNTRGSKTLFSYSRRSKQILAVVIVWLLRTAK